MESGPDVSIRVAYWVTSETVRHGRVLFLATAFLATILRAQQAANITTTPQPVSGSAIFDVVGIYITSEAAGQSPQVQRRPRTAAACVVLWEARAALLRSRGLPRRLRGQG